MKNMDHKFLNKDVDFFSERVPTAENIAIYAWGLLKPTLEDNSCSLHMVTVEESENISAVYKGPIT